MSETHSYRFVVYRTVEKYLEVEASTPEEAEELVRDDLADMSHDQFEQLADDKVNLLDIDGVELHAGSWSTQQGLAKPAQEATHTILSTVNSAHATVDRLPGGD